MVTALAAATGEWRVSQLRLRPRAGAESCHASRNVTYVQSVSARPTMRGLQRRLYHYFLYLFRIAKSKSISRKKAINQQWEKTIYFIVQELVAMTLVIGPAEATK